MGRLWMPGMPKTWRTPSRARVRTTHSPPVALIYLCGGPRYGPPHPPALGAPWGTHDAPRSYARSSHRLEAAVDRDVDKRRPGVPERPRERLTQRRRPIHALREHAHRAREREIVDLGGDQVH